MSKSRPRILFGAYQTRNFSNGGVESATRIFEGLADRFDWMLLTTREMPRTQRWRERGAKIIISPFDDRSSRLMRRLAGIRWFLNFVRARLLHRPGLVHLNDIQSYQAYSLRGTASKAVPLVFTLRDTTPPGEPYSPLWKRLARDAHRIVVLSEEMGRELCSKLPEACDKVTVINSIVDLASFSPPTSEEKATLRKRLGIGPDEFAVGCIGAISSKKGQLALAREALPGMLAADPEMKIHFIGDAGSPGDPYRQEFSGLLGKEPLAGRTVVHGHRDDVADWLRALDVVLIAANHEGLARAMIEGMACGVPIVSSDVCSAREMLEGGEAGIVVRKGDWTAMIEAIDRMRDPEIRRSFGKNGRRMAENRFDQIQVTAKFAALYEGIVSGPSGATSSGKK